jgi:hypothetical protein
MAKSNKKFNGSSKKASPVKNARPVRSTEVRNTPRPRTEKSAIPVQPPVITYEMIAQRAYDIHLSGTGGSPDDNWYRAERELRGV